MKGKNGRKRITLKRKNTGWSNDGDLPLTPLFLSQCFQLTDRTAEAQVGHDSSNIKHNLLLFLFSRGSVSED